MLLQGLTLDDELELLLEDELKLLELELLCIVVVGGIVALELLPPPPPQALRRVKIPLSKMMCFNIDFPLSIEATLLIFRIFGLAIVLCYGGSGRS